MATKLRAVLCLLTSVLAVAAIPLSGPVARAGIDEKIDEQVSARMGSGQAIPVLVLCRTQLLLGPDALERFAERNAGRPRSELRAEVIAELQALAAAEQPAVIASLGAGVQTRRFWIVNAVEAMLTPEQIERVAALDEVRYVYYARGFTPESPTGRGVATVLPENERPPFSTKGKRVGWNLKKIKATKVWKSLGVTGEGAVVALLDGGTEYTHEDLRGNVWRNPGEVPNNGLDDDANGYVDDLYGYDFTESAECMGTGQVHAGQALRTLDRRQSWAQYRARERSGGPGATAPGCGPRTGRCRTRPTRALTRPVLSSTSSLAGVSAAVTLRRTRCEPREPRVHGDRPSAGTGQVLGGKCYGPSAMGEGPRTGAGLVDALAAVKAARSASTLSRRDQSAGAVGDSG